MLSLITETLFSTIYHLHEHLSHAQNPKNRNLQYSLSTQWTCVSITSKVLKWTFIESHSIASINQTQTNKNARGPFEPITTPYQTMPNCKHSYHLRRKLLRGTIFLVETWKAFGVNSFFDPPGWKKIDTDADMRLTSRRRARIDTGGTRAFEEGRLPSSSLATRALVTGARQSRRWLLY